MSKGPKTLEEAGRIVNAFLMRKIEVIVSGRWAIDAFFAENPTEVTNEDQAWLEKYPPGGPLDLSFRFDDQEIVESVITDLGFRFCGDSYFENGGGEVVSISFFRPARDGGRIYPKLGLDGEDWYYSPRTVTDGRLGLIRVRTEGPLTSEEARAALPTDEAY